jgi:hypothetical protein
MESTLFFSNLSIVDGAYINSKGQIIGVSYNPSFKVTGVVDDIERVVIDFSTAKKRLKFHLDKHLFDIHKNGFDHKLHLIENYSDCSFVDDGKAIILYTDACSLTLPSDAVRWIKNPDHLDVTDEFIGNAFAEHLTESLSLEYPGVDIKVECVNSMDEHIIDKEMPISFFRYSHGLKNSTSFGCQNVAHGHLSFIQYEDQDACDFIGSELHNAVFINPENIRYEDDDRITISYTTPERGFFGATYIKALNKIIVLDTETTIEYIAAWVADKYGISKFYLSEGLSKGCYID